MVNEIGLTRDTTTRIDEVKAVVTLRSGRELKTAVPELVKSAPVVTEPLQEEPSVAKEEVKIQIPPPFPQAIRKKKNHVNQTEMLEVLREVKVNIPLLDMIKQVPTYAKFLKDLCTVKRSLKVNKKVFLTEQVSAIIGNKTPVKYKDPGCPTISVNIGGTSVEKALLDLGASVNLLPYSMYKRLGLGELKPTSITLSLADRSIKIPKGTIEDVLIQVDKFYYPVDFVVLDTEPVAVGPNHVPIILGRPFLATSNAIINCRNGVMQLTFGNMTLELNIFHLGKRHMHSEGGDFEEVCILDAIQEEQTSALISKEESQEEECLNGTIVEESCLQQPQQGLVENSESLEIGVVVCLWEKEDAIPLLLTEEAVEENKENIFPLPPTDSVYILPLPAPQSQPKTLLPVAPSDNQVYIQPQPAANSKPAAPAPKGMSNPLPAAPPESVFILPTPAAQPKPQASTTKAIPSMVVLQNIRRLVASVHAFATTSKTMATAYIAWHSGWFGCGFGFGAPVPRHF